MAWDHLVLLDFVFFSILSFFVSKVRLVYFWLLRLVSHGLASRGLVSYGLVFDFLR